MVTCFLGVIPKRQHFLPCQRTSADQEDTDKKMETKRGKRGGWGGGGHVMPLVVSHLLHLLKSFAFSVVFLTSYWPCYTYCIQNSVNRLAGKENIKKYENRFFYMSWSAKSA